MRKLRLVQNWRRFMKWYSMHSMLLTIALLGAWAALPAKMQDAFSPMEIKLMAIALLVLGVGGRLVDQTPRRGQGGEPQS